MTEGRLAPEEVRTRTFTRVMRGYRRREVRRLLERAAADLVRLRNGPVTTGPGEQPPLTPEDVEEVRFQPALGGYEMDEVDQFLDRLMIELERAAHEPLRPPSALPSPPRHASFPQLRDPLPAAPPPEIPVDPEVAPSMGPVAGPAERLAPGPAATPEPAVGPEPEPAVGQERAVGPEPEPAVGQERAVGPAERPEPAGAVGPVLGPPPAPEPASPARPPPPPAPAPPPPPPAPEAETDEGWFPPESVPPSAAPAAPPPRPAEPVASQPVAPGRPLTPSEVETRSFERGAPGYLPNHVDLFLAKAARAMAGRDGETMSRWDVLRQRFPLGPRGYATSEVDAFLVRLAAQFPDPDPEVQQEILRKLQDR
jgi:DivIVA domain-containing protein